LYKAWLPGKGHCLVGEKKREGAGPGQKFPPGFRPSLAIKTWERMQKVREYLEVKMIDLEEYRK